MTNPKSKALVPVAQPYRTTQQLYITSDGSREVMDQHTIATIARELMAQYPGYDVSADVKAGFFRKVSAKTVYRVNKVIAIAEWLGMFVDAAHDAIDIAPRRPATFNEWMDWAYDMIVED